MVAGRLNIAHLQWACYQLLVETWNHNPLAASSAVVVVVRPGLLQHTLSGAAAGSTVAGASWGVQHLWASTLPFLG